MPCSPPVQVRRQPERETASPVAVGTSFSCVPVGVTIEYSVTMPYLPALVRQGYSVQTRSNWLDIPLTKWPATITLSTGPAVSDHPR